MSTDLFSFLNDNNNDSIQGQDEPMDVEEVKFNPQTLKRKAASPSIDTSNAKEDTKENLEDTLPLNRPKIDVQKPIVLDDFETEAKREVAASAGLTGGTVESGSRLELRHQVCMVHILHPTRPMTLFRCDIKSQYLQATITFPFPNIFHQPSRTGSTSSSWIPSRGSRYTPSREMKAYWYLPTLVLERQLSPNIPLHSALIESRE
jgi:hypothetical protein